MIVRRASSGDVEAGVAFEIEIARVSFGDDAVTDPDVHRKRIEKALGDEREGVFVAEDEDGAVAGWAWVSLRTNFLTKERYANLRSLAGREAESLMAHALEHAKSLGAREVTGKVHVSNAAMRVLYRKLGFTAEHLTMRWRG